MHSVSIVIPTKNSAGTLRGCLSSLMPYVEQGYINEIIVVDGHSTDETEDIVKEYSAKLIYEQVKGSIGLAYDIGWRETTGDIVILFDSDVYLKEGFFPEILEILADESVGWISCRQKPVISSDLTRTQGEDWTWGSGILSKSPSWFQKIFNIALTGRTEPTYGGPCMVVRRNCIEAVDGFQGLSMGTLMCCGDISVSQRIEAKGWKTIWWYEAPIYHEPRPRFKGYVKQMYGYGVSIASMHLEKEFRHQYPWYNKIFGIFARLSSPLIGLYLAIRYRNPSHLVVYPVPRYAVVAGYVVGWFRARKLVAAGKL